MASFSELILWTTVTVVLLTVIYRYVRRRRQWSAIIDKIPGPKGVPLLGISWQMLTSRENVAKASRGMVLPFYPKNSLVRLWVGPFPLVLALKAEAAKVILNSSKHIEKAIFYRYLRNWIGDGLLTSTGSKWQHRRKLITPSFHFRILENFLLVMNEQAEILIQQLDQNCKQIKYGEFDIYPFITRCTLDIICETAMGQGVNAQVNADSEYVNAVNSLAQVVKMRMSRPWLAPDWIFRLTKHWYHERSALKIVHGFTNKIIKMKRSKLSQSKLSKDKESDDVLGMKRRVALLDMLLENSMEDSSGQQLTDEDIREEVDTFMFEGHDTTAVGISWALYCIGQYPQIQQKMADELHAIFGDSNREASSEDLHSMKYTECVIKESMRHFPPVPAYGRTLREELEICGYKVPPGVTVIISPFLVQRDPAFYTNPEAFDPDQFLPENIQNRDPFAYIPFSAGLRNCIGQKFAVMEEKVVISRILRQFTVTTVPEPDIYSNLVSELVLRPIRGIRVKLEPRPTKN